MNYSNHINFLIIIALTKKDIALNAHKYVAAAGHNMVANILKKEFDAINNT